MSAADVRMLECALAGRDAQFLPLEMEVPLQGTFPEEISISREEVHHHQQVGNFAIGT